MINWTAHARTIRDHVWGPTGSVVFHTVLILVLIRFAGQMGGDTVAPPVEVMMEVKGNDVALDKLTDKLDEAVEQPLEVEAVKPPDVSTDTEPPEVNALVPGPSAPGADAGDAGAGAGSGDAAGDGNTSDGDDLSGLAILDGVGPLKLKGLYASRSAGGRAAGLAKYGGGFQEGTEYAVKKAMQWLKTHQYPDGSWGPSYRPAMTGLALLAFLAHNETTASEEYGDAVRRGLRYLLSVQKNGIFYDSYHHPYFPEQVSVYEHAIATYAMSEAYGLTGIPILKTAMEDAVQVILDGQHEGGHWDYAYKKGPEAHLDVSLAGWHVQALKAAYAAGAENKGLKTAIESGLRGMVALMAKDNSGLFRYSTRIERKPDMTMTGVAVLAMQLSGHAMDPEARAGMKALQDLAFRWTKGEGGQDIRAVADWPLYAWYYITQARFHQGGKTWSNWNRQFAPVLCGMQNDDGSWCPAPESSESGLGPVYCTALSALMLEIYYRFLPTYQPIEVEQNKAPEKPADDEIVIKFG